MIVNLLSQILIGSNGVFFSTAVVPFPGHTKKSADLFAVSCCVLSHPELSAKNGHYFHRFGSPVLLLSVREIKLCRVSLD